MEIHENEKVFLLDAPISQTGLFGEAVSSVVEIFHSAKSESAALKQPRRMMDFSNTPTNEDLQALSDKEVCMDFAPGLVKVTHLK